jgi:UDP-glucose 4-epimerase
MVDPLRPAHPDAADPLDGADRVDAADRLDVVDLDETDPADAIVVTDPLAVRPLDIAVTGGSGFIGSHVVDALVAAGHRVRVVDLRPPHRGDVGHRPVDISDVPGLVAAFDGAQVVFHLAAVSNINDAYDLPVEAVRINVGGTAAVWEAARRAGVYRAVLASTVWVYAGAEGEGPFDEQDAFHLPKAGHVYTSSKIAAELIVHNYAELYGQRFTILRYGIPYGPRMRDELVIPRFLRTALSGQPLTINGDGSQYRNYVYIADLAEAHVRVLSPVAENEVINLEGTEQVSIRRVADTVRELIGEHVRVVHVPGRAGDYAGKEVSAAKAWRLLGWRAGTSFEDGMRHYVSEYLASRVADEVEATMVTGD